MGGLHSFVIKRIIRSPISSMKQDVGFPFFAFLCIFDRKSLARVVKIPSRKENGTVGFIGTRGGPMQFLKTCDNCTFPVVKSVESP